MKMGYPSGDQGGNRTHIRPICSRNGITDLKSAPHASTVAWSFLEIIGQTNPRELPPLLTLELVAVTDPDMISWCNAGTTPENHVGLLNYRVPFCPPFRTFADAFSRNSYSSIIPISQIENTDTSGHRFSISQATYWPHRATASTVRADIHRSPAWGETASTFFLHAIRVSHKMGA